MIIEISRSKKKSRAEEYLNQNILSRVKYGKICEFFFFLEPRICEFVVKINEECLKLFVCPPESERL